MIEIRNIKVPVAAGMAGLEQQIMKLLHIKHVPEYEIVKRSIDARKQTDIHYLYQVVVLFDEKTEAQILKRINNKNIMSTNRILYRFPAHCNAAMKQRPLIIGAGPAGLFCALILSRCGYQPLIVERGAPVEERVSIVNDFFEGKPLNTECNVQFGEGGAGTFSDGKLNTQTKDKYGRIRFVLETFVRHGASPEIMYDNKPHIGTDKLIHILKEIRHEIEQMGGTFYFHTKAEDIEITDKAITAVTLLCGQGRRRIEAGQVIFAIGHSARDTFEMLQKRKVPMEAKDFAVGVRIEHPAAWIKEAMYGTSKEAAMLPNPPYKLTHQTGFGRGVYSFCMCPGGYVVNASSEPEHTAVNGMSYSGRSGINSNSALIVTVRKSDFEDASPLAGIAFQRKLEHAIYQEGKGKIVVQRFADFEQNVPTKESGTILPQTKGLYVWGNVAGCLPDFVKDSIIEGIHAFERRIPGFSHEDAVISGVESRTSAPIRILRQMDFQSEIRGIYPCGEGAGYAGGIMSAAMDGMKAAEAVIQELINGGSK